MLRPVQAYETRAILDHPQLFGPASWIRTNLLVLFRHALIHLSYSGIEWCARRDLHTDARRRQHLKLVRLLFRHERNVVGQLGFEPRP
jgi:hypothetical protein